MATQTYAEKIKMIKKYKLHLKSYVKFLKIKNRRLNILGKNIESHDAHYWASMIPRGSSLSSVCTTERCRNFARTMNQACDDVISAWHFDEPECFPRKWWIARFIETLRYYSHNLHFNVQQDIRHCYGYSSCKLYLFVS